MYARIHKFGKSFKGVAAYVLHDAEKAKTNERVAWTQTVNLGTDNPHAAWRVMAATAMAQDQLKENAGVKKTGRKSNKTVLHMTLSWHPDEAETLTRAEMEKAANDALASIGAQNRQALIVAHTDTAHPHIHIIANRVSQENGKILTSSKDHLKLSKWAETYERERGKIYCEDRVLNNAARDRKEYTLHHEDRRKINRQEPANDDKARKLVEEQRAKDHRLLQAEERRAARHRDQWDALEQRRLDRLARLEDRFRADRKNREIEEARARKKVRGEWKVKWRDLYRQQERDLQAFRSNEDTIIGKARNVLKTLSVKEKVRTGERSKMTRAFTVLAGQEAREKLFEAKQKCERDRFGEAQRRREDLMASYVRRDALKKLEADKRNVMRQFARERSDLLLIQKGERAHERAAWRTRRVEREAVWDGYRRERAIYEARSHARSIYEDGYVSKRFNTAERSTSTRASDAYRRAIERDYDRQQGRDQSDDNTLDQSD